MDIQLLGFRYQEIIEDGLAFCYSGDADLDPRPKGELVNRSDQWLVCADCGRQFLWDRGEQAWYRVKGLRNPPKHCKPCRTKRRKERLHEPRQYSKVSCDNCGTETIVPFVPLGTKPIYCRSCMAT